MTASSCSDTKIRCLVGFPKVQFVSRQRVAMTVCLARHFLRNLPLLSYTYRIYSRVMWDEWYHFLKFGGSDM